MGDVAVHVENDFVNLIADYELVEWIIGPFCVQRAMK